MSVTDPKELPTTFEDVFDGIAFEGLQILYDRQRKYGPHNIFRQGMYGVFLRIRDDKIARIERAFNGVLEHGVLRIEDLQDFDDESFEDALLDVSNLALIMVALKRGLWGKPMREDTGEIEALAAGRSLEDLQLMTVEEARQALLGEDEGLREPEYYEDADAFLAPLATPEELASLQEHLASPQPDREAAADRLEAARVARNLGGQD